MQYYDKEKVGKRIQKARKNQKLTQEKLAEQLDYSSVRQLQRIENGETGCAVDKLMEIAQILHTTTDYLLFGTNPKEQWDEPILHLLSNKTRDQKEYAYLLLKAAMEHLVVLSKSTA